MQKELEELMAGAEVCLVKGAEISKDGLELKDIKPALELFKEYETIEKAFTGLGDIQSPTIEEYSEIGVRFFDIMLKMKKAYDNG